jgi:LuxR family maltose regulon positive regulatory protein
MLRRLEAANLFLQPVDAARRWYRYHPLFSSQVLATHLREAPGEAEAGHRRASAWFEARGLARDAIRHALAGHDISHAVALLEAALADLAKEGQVTDFDAWLTQVPAETRANPRLALAFTWSAMYRGELGQVRDRVGAVERLLAGHPEPDAAAARDYACQVASLRSWLALFLDLDPAAGLTRARQAVALAPGLEPMIQAGAVHCLAHAHFAAGDVAAADRAFGDSVALAQAGGSVYSEILVTYFWAATMLEAGRLTVARELCLWLLARHAEPAAHAALLTPIHYALALIEYERSELEAAERWLALVGAAEVKIGYAAAAARLLAARVALARGEAVAVGEAAAALPYVSFRSALAPGPHALDVWLRTGRVDLARAAARAWGLGNLPPGPLTLAELTARAAILRADGDPRASLALTAQLGPIAEGARLDGHAVRILIERALALAAAGDGAGALGALGRALDLAAKEGFVRAFVDAGPEMAALLQLACARGDGGPYARTLLDAFGPARGAEPLTAREREVLALLARRMSYAEISAALVVSLNTVRTHVKSIYAKLGVGSAEEAVARAGEGAFGTRRRGV